MRKIQFLLFIALMALSLDACTTPRQTQTQANTQSIQETAVPVDTQQPATKVATTPPTATMEPVPVNSKISGEPMPGCTVAGKIIEPNPTIAALFPAVGENDWVLGKNDAAATFVEYGDFQ